MYTVKTIKGNLHESSKFDEEVNDYLDTLDNEMLIDIKLSSIPDTEDNYRQVVVLIITKVVDC